MLGENYKGLIALGAIFLAMPLQAQMVSPESEFDKRVRSSQTVQPLGEKPFGELIDLYTGAISFRQTDIVQEGQGLPIELSRTLEINDRSFAEAPSRAFADWRLDVPKIETIIGAERFGLKCTGISPAPTIVLNNGASSSPIFYPPEQWWGGYQLVIPGAGRQEILKRDAANGNVPQAMPIDGATIDFSLTTKSQWAIGCLQKTANGIAGDGFFVVSPEGTKYWMDWSITKPYTNVGFGQPNGVTRSIAMRLVSRVEDRFGNSLFYQYDADGNLTRISSSDGRSLTLIYEPWSQRWASTGTTEGGVVLPPQCCKHQIPHLGLGHTVMAYL